MTVVDGQLHPKRKIRFQAVALTVPGVFLADAPVAGLSSFKAGQSNRRYSRHVIRPPPARLPMQALEEQNLFFIQNSQETEHALDELKQNFGKVQKTMDTKTQVREGVCKSHANFFLIKIGHARPLIPIPRTVAPSSLVAFSTDGSTVDRNNYYHTKRNDGGLGHTTLCTHGYALWQHRFLRPYDPTSGIW